MKPNLNHSAFIWTIFFTLGLSMLLAFSCRAQYSIITTPTSDCTVCDGVLTIELEENTDYDFAWFDYTSGVLIDEVSASAFEIILPGQCPGNYIGELSINNELYTFPYAIGASNTQTGTGGIAYVCESSDQFDLAQALSGQQDPGTWIDPLGNPHSGIFQTATDPPGEYTYTVNGECTLESVVELILNEPADAGIATTYLICENYPIFSMYDVLFGDPETGGEWFDVNSLPTDEFYYPDSQDGGFFTYIIDTVPGCPPEQNSLFIIENQIPDPGEDSYLTVCPDAPLFELYDYILGSPEQGGYWEDPNGDDFNGIFDISVNGEGTYTYIVDGDTPCPTRSSEITVSFNDGIDAGENGELLICSSDNSVDLFNFLEGNPDVDGNWIDPEGDFIDGILDPATAVSGDYLYLIEAVGCEPESSVVSVNIDQPVDAGDDSNAELCLQMDVLDLNDFLSFGVENTGQWFDEQGNIINNQFEPVEGENSIYTYMINGGACPDDESEHDLNFLPTPDAGPDLNLEFCSTEGIINLESYVNVPGNLNSQWLDESLDASSPSYSSADGSTTVYFTVESINVCPSDTAEITILIQEPEFTDEFEELFVCSIDPLIALNDELPDGFPQLGSWSYQGQIMDTPAIDPDEFNEGLYTFQADQFDICPAPVFELEINIAQMPDAGNGGEISRCFNDEVIILADLPDADATAGGQWLFNGEDIETEDFTPNGGGNLVYFLEGPEVCPSTQAIWEVEILPSPGFSAGDDVSNCSDAAPLNIGQESDPSYTYLWSPSEGLSDDEASSPLVFFETTGDTEETTNYTVEVSNEFCTITDTLTVTVFPLPEIALPAEASLCALDTLTLIVQESFSYSWEGFSGDVNLEEDQLNIIPNQSGVFELQAFNDFGCTTTTQMDITLFDLPDAQFSLDPLSGCPPLEIELINESENSEETNYIWFLEETQLFSDTLLTLHGEGSYNLSLQAFSNEGCSFTQSLENVVEVYPDPVADFSILPEQPNVYTPEIRVFNDGFFQVGAEWSLNGNYLSNSWNPDFTIPVIEDVEQNLCLEVINTFGCRDTLCKRIVVQGDFTLYVPNAFTPNSDGRNELFIPVIQGADVDYYEFKVFNRWGEEIFSTGNIDEGWYGNVKGGDHYAAPGLYVWQIKLRNKYNGNDVLERGSVTLIR